MNEAVRDQFGVWHVCYSTHSSKEELEWALQLLVPKWFVSTTPSCREMELDFVKKHCFGNKVAPNDPIWKLLDIAMEGSLDVDVSIKGVSGSPMVEEHAQTYAQPQFEPAKVSTGLKGLIKLSPPSKKSDIIWKSETWSPRF